MYSLGIFVGAFIRVLGALAKYHLVKKGIAVVCKSVTHARIAENIKGATAAHQKLQKSDVEDLDKLAEQGKQHRSVAHSAYEPPWLIVFVSRYQGSSHLHGVSSPSSIIRHFN